MIGGVGSKPNSLTSRKVGATADEAFVNTVVPGVEGIAAGPSSRATSVPGWVNWGVSVCGSCLATGTTG